MSGVTTEQLDEWERLANEAERGRRHNASTSEMLAVIKFETVSRLAVPQLVAEVRRLRGLVKESYIEGYIAGDSDGGMYPDVCRRSAETEWPTSKARAALETP